MNIDEGKYMRDKIKKIRGSGIIILCSLLFLSSCSTSFAYNNVGWLSSFWIDDYISLNKAQSKQLRGIINNTRDWHREVELPKYKTDLVYLRQLLNAETDAELLMQAVSDLKLHWHNLLTYSSEPLITFALTLSQTQKHEFVDNIAKKIAEESSELQSQSLQVIKESRLKKQLEYYNDWLGTLSESQRLLISEANDAHINTSLLWQAYKRARLEALSQLFNSTDLNETAFKQQLKIIIVEREQFMSSELTEINEQNLTAYAQLLVNLNKTLSTKQQQHVDKKIAKLVSMVSGLIIP